MSEAIIRLQDVNKWYGQFHVLRNINLDRFMKRYNEAQELAPRDVVARAIVSEMHRTNSNSASTPASRIASSR